MSLLRSADAILPIEPSGRDPHLAILVEADVGEPQHLGDHNCITSSRVAGSLRSSGSAAHVDVNAWMVPEPFAGMVPPIDTRSFINVVNETRQPSPGLPNISESGMRVSVKYTSLNSASPVIWRSGRTSTPGAFMSTTNAVSPACLTASASVRTTSSPNRDKWASVVHTF